jgi:hypothetical protein
MAKENDIQEVAVTLQQYDLLVRGIDYSYEQLHASIAEKINFLITNNFSRFISVLYQLDISEKKLKTMLEDASGVPSANIIATIIIERQLQKIETRKAFKSEGFSDEEKW